MWSYVPVPDCVIRHRICFQGALFFLLANVGALWEIKAAHAEELTLKTGSIQSRIASLLREMVSF